MLILVMIAIRERLPDYHLPHVHQVLAIVRIVQAAHGDCLAGRRRVHEFTITEVKRDMPPLAPSFEEQEVAGLRCLEVNAMQRASLILSCSR